jgi:hypothetical protein
LSAFTRNRDGTLNSWTNALEDFQSAGNPSAFWNISDGAAVLNVAGVANEFINWKAVLKQLSVIGGEPTPSGFEWIVQDRFNSGPLSTNWTLTQGLTNYVDGFHETSPLEGAGSLLITVPTTGTTASHVILEHTMVAGQSEAWAFFRMSVSALPSGDFELCRIGNSYVTLRSTGNLRLTHGSSVTSRTTSDVVAGNTYDIWLYYKQSTGTDGVLRLWRDTTASGDKANATMRTELTNGTSGSSAYRFRLSGTKSSSISSAIQVKLDLAYAAHSSFEVIP